MTNDPRLAVAVGCLALVVGVFTSQGEPTCTTTTTSKCTSSGESCTVTKKLCTEFLPDGRTVNTTSTSHDCGPGGPQDCKKGSGASIIKRPPSRYPVTVKTTTDTKPAGSPTPTPPTKRANHTSQHKH